MKNISLFLLALVTYIVVDVGYNVVVGLGIDTAFYREAGILDIFELSSSAPVFFLLFFILITLGNLVLVIKPAIAKKSVKRALWNGFLLGVVAYATYALTCAWLIKDYPIPLVPIHIVGGGLFSFASSGFTTFVALKRSK